MIEDGVDLGRDEAGLGIEFGFILEVCSRTFEHSFRLAASV